MKEGVNYAAANGTDSFQLGDMEQDGDTEDSKDSDAVQLFELPKRKLVRPMSSALRRKIRPANKCWKTTKECCRVFVTVTLPMLIAVFIVSTILCLTFLLVGIAGMKQEISMLKLRLKNVDAAERSFMGKKEQLRREFQNKLSNIVSYQTELLKMKSSVQRLSSHISKLNATVHQFHAKPTTQVSSKLAILQHDIDTLKTGMADTGADIEKLRATGKQLEKDVGGLNTDMKESKLKIYNITVQISEIEHKPPPPMTTTPKTLVVTVVPDQDKPPTRKELKSILADSEQKQIDACKKEVSLYGIKLDELRNDTWHMNRTYSDEISYLRHYILSRTAKTEPPITKTSGNTSSSHADNHTTTLKPTPLSKPIHTAHDVKPSGNNTTIKPISSPTQEVTLSASVTVETPTNTTLITQQVKEGSVNTTMTSQVDVTTEHSNSTQNRDREKREKLNDIKEDDILEKYESNKDNVNFKDKIDKIKPLLREYIKRKKEKMEGTGTELDNLDAGNSK